jgi:signal recognition particle GTPase
LPGAGGLARGRLSASEELEEPEEEEEEEEEKREEREKEEGEDKEEEEDEKEAEEELEDDEELRLARLLARLAGGFAVLSSRMPSWLNRKTLPSPSL